MSEKLPSELEREIFEIAAVQNPKSIPTFLRVCRRVRAWLEPFLYQVLMILHWNAPLLFAVESKAGAWLRAAVRHAFFHIKSEYEATKVKNLLTACSDISNLTLIERSDPDDELIDILDKMRLQKLDLTLTSSAPDWGLVTLGRPMFLSVTHLAMFKEPRFAGQQEQWLNWAPLASLPALTYLSLSEYLSLHLLSQTLSQCPRLVLAITTFCGEYERNHAISFARGITISDPRVVVMLVADYIKDWERGAWGAPDYWARAQTFAAQKRPKGEIEGVRYFLDEIKAIL
ncbi:hypothetical protein DFH06DRAFT_391574 [Mycena polygramma]|nr:hypothetical protein DFH06DRAFT_391574 [Mycena polygramma]